MSPFAASRAFLHSMTETPVLSRSSLTASLPTVIVRLLARRRSKGREVCRIYFCNLIKHQCYYMARSIVAGYRVSYLCPVAVSIHKRDDRDTECARLL